MIYNIVITVICVILLSIFFFKYQKQAFLNITASVVIDAEAFFKSGEGDKKLEYACEIISRLLPWYIRMFIGTNVIKATIEEVLKGMQKLFKQRVGGKNE